MINLLTWKMFCTKMMKSTNKFDQGELYFQL